MADEGRMSGKAARKHLENEFLIVSASLRRIKKLVSFAFEGYNFRRKLIFGVYRRLCPRI